MIEIQISEDFKRICPELKIAAIEFWGENSAFSSGLWSEIEQFTSGFKEKYKLEDINRREAILATRNAYKKLGKDPNRYRPSAEALCRRVLRDLPLYRINTFVDLINLVSLHSGYSIGGFDADRIDGNLILGIGKENELFDAIGRGKLNIENLPVYRDRIAGIGTPTSDEERTKLNTNTTHLLMIINAYSGESGLQETIDYSLDLLYKYALNIKTENAFEIKIY